MRRTAVAVALAAGLTQWIARPGYAQSVEWEGYLDLRAAAPADETSWLKGGAGKTRFGGGGDAASDDALSGGAALAAIFQVTPALLATATVQYRP